MGKSKLIIYTVLFLVLMISFLRFLNIAGGRNFNLQFIGFSFLLLLMLLGYIGYSSKWGERSFFFFFVLYMANLIGIWYFFRTLYLTLLLVSLIGFFMSFPKREYGEVFSDHKEPVKEEKAEVPKVEIVHEEVKEEAPKKTVKKPAKKKSAKTTAKVTTKKATTTKKVTKTSSKVTAAHTPGKFVASSNSNVYHMPKCDWAKRIKEPRRVWFTDKKDALSKGYRAHSCAK